MDPLCSSCPGEEGGGNSSAWKERTLDHYNEGYEEEESDNTDNSDSRCSSEDDIIEEVDTTEVVAQQVNPAWARCQYPRPGLEVYFYVGQEIRIQESIDSYGAVIWPAALALCHFLETHREQVDLQGKEVLELGAGPGLVSIVASLLGASVTATDLPEILGNLTSNLMRNTRGRCRDIPKVAELSWGPEVERTFPRSVCHYDYVLGADVVYHHDFLAELLVTMRHFCRPGTTLIWSNKVRFPTDLTFTKDFRKAFHTTLLADYGEVKIFMATSRG